MNISNAGCDRLRTLDSIIKVVYLLLLSNALSPNRVLAEEQKDLGGLRILNYAPGPMDTDMSAEVRESGFGDTFDYVDVEASAAKCVRLALGDKSFEVGAHIDFFDKEYD